MPYGVLNKTSAHEEAAWYGLYPLFPVGNNINVKYTLTN